MEISQTFFELDIGHLTIFLSMRMFSICLATPLQLKPMGQSSPTIYVPEQRYSEEIKAR